MSAIHLARNKIVINLKCPLHRKNNYLTLKTGRIGLLESRIQNVLLICRKYIGGNRDFDPKTSKCTIKFNVIPQ